MTEFAAVYKQSTNYTISYKNEYYKGSGSFNYDNLDDRISYMEMNITDVVNDDEVIGDIYYNENPDGKVNYSVPEHIVGNVFDFINEAALYAKNNR